MSSSTKIPLSICLCLFLIALYVTNSSLAANTSPVPQTQQAAKTVEQTRKNIQVLKGLPDSQLYFVMNFVAVSLGVQCQYCHVTNGKDPKTGFTNWVWESDDKPEKQAARRMMQMVLSINASNKVDFRQNAVTCYTCHRGQTSTVRLPSMPLTRSGHEGAPTEAATAPATRPSVDEIFAKYLEAVGGAKATNTKTFVMKGKREASQNRTWPNDITFAAPDKYLVVANTPQALIRQIVNGEQGWILNGSNVRALTPAEADDTRRGWEDIFAVIKVKRTPGLIYVGREKIGSRDSYVVVNSTPDRIESYYFDVESGLLVRKATITPTAVLPIPEQIDFEDYRDVDGVKLPFLIRDSAIDTFNSWTRTFSEIKRNVDIDESSFAMPAPKP
jgi:photosynthetic reaction center cytochrome c subunit